MPSLLPQALVPLSVIAAPKRGVSGALPSAIGGLITPVEW